MEVTVKEDPFDEMVAHSPVDCLQRLCEADAVVVVAAAAVGVGVAATTTLQMMMMWWW